MSDFREATTTFHGDVVVNGSLTLAETPAEIVITNLTGLALGTDGAGSAAPTLSLKKTDEGVADVAFKSSDDLRGRVRLDASENLVIGVFDADEVATGTITMTNATGAVALSGALAVTGATTLAAAACTTLAASGAVTCATTLGVTGASTLAAVACTTLAASGAVTCATTLGVAGASTLAALACTTLAASGAVTCATTLGVTGATTMAAAACTTLAASSNATVGGTLGVTGVTTLAAASSTTLTASTSLVVTGASVVGLHEYVTVPIGSLTGTGVYGIPSPVAGTIVKIQSRLSAALATGDATITAKIGAVAVTTGVITIAEAASAAGDIDVCNPSGANTVVVGSNVNFTIGGTNSADVGATIVVTFLRSA
jgi:hypothetical protein